MRAHLSNNNDSSSQSSRLTKQIEALELEAASNSSVNGRNKLQSTIGENQVYEPYYSDYRAAEGREGGQVCFACGCTCRSKPSFMH
jgi:hypothetical protein